MGTEKQKCLPIFSWELLIMVSRACLCFNLSVIQLKGACLHGYICGPNPWKVPVNAHILGTNCPESGTFNISAKLHICLNGNLVYIYMYITYSSIYIYIYISHLYLHIYISLTEILLSEKISTFSLLTPRQVMTSINVVPNVLRSHLSTCSQGTVLGYQVVGCSFLMIF